MNKYKRYLDSFYEKLERYKFAANKTDYLFNDDARQLANGGDYLNISHIYIRDWSNFSDTNWQIDYRRSQLVSKKDYLNEIDQIKSMVFKHYLVEAYERLIEFVGLVLSIDKRRLTIDRLVKNLDVDLHNRNTPFGFNLITFLITFCKVRNALTHNNGIIKANEAFRYRDYMKGFDFNRREAERFLAMFFETTPGHEGEVHLDLSKHSFDIIIGFVRSYAFELYKHRCENEGIDWKIQKESPRKDIKTSLPLNETQSYHYARQLIERISSEDECQSGTSQ